MQYPTIKKFHSNSTANLSTFGTACIIVRGWCIKACWRLCGDIFCTIHCTISVPQKLWLVMLQSLSIQYWFLVVRRSVLLKNKETPGTVCVWNGQTHKCGNNAFHLIPGGWVENFSWNPFCKQVVQFYVPSCVFPTLCKILTQIGIFTNPSMMNVTQFHCHCCLVDPKLRWVLRFLHCMSRNVWTNCSFS